MVAFQIARAHFQLYLLLFVKLVENAMSGKISGSYYTSDLVYKAKKGKQVCMIQKILQKHFFRDEYLDLV